MKIRRLMLVAIIMMLALFVGCTNAKNPDVPGGDVELKEATQLNSIDYVYSSNAAWGARAAVGSNKDYKALLNENLSMISSDVILDNLNGKNIVISPLSIYLALVLATYVADDDIKNIIFNKFNLKDSDIALTQNLIKSLIYYYKTDGCVIDCVDITNSIWVQDGLKTDEEVLKKLADELFCYAYQADFAKNNKKANDAIQKFIKEKTNGLIDQDFELDKDTILSIINTIYLKSLWNSDGADLVVTQKEFTNYDNTKITCDFLNGEYNNGKVYETSDYKMFYTTTSAYKLKFIVPNGDKKVEDILTKENLAKLNTCEYETQNDELLERYHTRCIFPKYKGSCDIDLTKTLKEKYGLDKLFARFNSKLTNDTAYVSVFKHVAKIDVNEHGIEAAAVTIMAMCGAAGPGEYTDIYYEFLVDKAFGYLVTDGNGVILFSGVCNTVK